MNKVIVDNELHRRIRIKAAELGINQGDVIKRAMNALDSQGQSKNPDKK